MVYSTCLSWLWDKDIEGGDFAFGSIGQVLKCEHGDVIVYNPKHHHGTTKFLLYENDVESSCVFFTVYFMEKAGPPCRPIITASGE
jgi:hypothetical protein